MGSLAAILLIALPLREPLGDCCNTNVIAFLLIAATLLSHASLPLDLCCIPCTEVLLFISSV